MLSYLRIRGLALLDDVTLELSPGMNVLTGETGAGKSIIVDALALLRGARARSSALRGGVEALHVDAQFELGREISARVKPVLSAHGLPSEDATLVARRTVPRSGRGRCFLQAELTTQGVFSEVGEVLIDICSQHEHHSLTHVARHLDLLDGYTRLDAELGGYQEAYREYKRLAAELADLSNQSGEGASRADYLRFQIEELERVAPEPGEAERLRRQLELLRNAQRWEALAQAAHETLYESEESIVGRLAGLAEQARRGRDQSERLAAIAEQLEAAAVACEEADREATRFLSELDLDPAGLERAEARLSELLALGRKHGGDLSDLEQRLDSMRSELDALDHLEERIAALQKATERARAKCVELADGLHRRRERSRKQLADAVVKELAALHMPQARFEARLDLLPEEQLGPRGRDRVEFLFSANPGEPLAPLTQVASGGELSRVLLAIKGVLATGDEVATYVFDEVDAGVGGSVAQAIGQRLHLAAHSHQVLCITHLPQIAAFADAHYRVDKLTQRGRTITRVAELSQEDRVEELARMLGGAKVTESARQHARELLDQAHSGAEQPALANRAKRKRSPARARGRG
jgi:DNA repair protein RecN (Recombination protein N)